jgi:hypothetical protein
MDRGESYRLWKETVIKQFAEYKKTGRFLVEFPRLLFKRLEESGLISLNKEDRARIYAQAIEYTLEAKKRARIAPKSRNEMNEATNFINRQAEGRPKPEDIDLFKEEARIIAIKEFWNGINIFNL